MRAGGINESWIEQTAAGNGGFLLMGPAEVLRPRRRVASLAGSFFAPCSSAFASFWVSVNYLTECGAKIWEPPVGKLNAT
jgi:hypothetical protein